MSFSSSTQQDWARKALRLMLEGLGEQEIGMEPFCPQDEPFCSIPSTTWADLERLGYVEPANNLTLMYYLTGLGWHKALELESRLSEPAFVAKLVQLTKELKRHVKGRREEALVSLESVARKSDLSEAFVSNAIEARLLNSRFDQIGVEWANERKDMIYIPITYGLQPMSEL